MKPSTPASIALLGRTVDYRLVRSKAARRLRVRVGPNGVEVIRPASRKPEEVADFLQTHSAWIAGQLDRVSRLRGIRRPGKRSGAEILLRGQPTGVLVERRKGWLAPNRVTLRSGNLVIIRGASATPASVSLENWLRREAKVAIQRHLAAVGQRLKRVPHKLYVMDQRTKWGNCSAKGNLSFNWRLILAPEFVLRYLVTHETVHLAVPDHSHRFWLIVQGLCPEMERAKQWLSANTENLLVDLQTIDLKPR